MAKVKQILAAGIVRDILFDSPDSADLYLYRLVHRGFTFKVLQSCRFYDGTVILRVLQRYNDYDLIELYDYCSWSVPREERI